MPSSLHTERSLESLQMSHENEQLPLDIGQTVVVSSGILQGMSGVVLKRSALEGFVVSLEGQSGQVMARLPTHLLQVQ